MRKNGLPLTYPEDVKDDDDTYEKIVEIFKKAKDEEAKRQKDCPEPPIRYPYPTHPWQYGRRYCPCCGRPERFDFDPGFYR